MSQNESDRPPSVNEIDAFLKLSQLRWCVRHLIVDSARGDEDALDSLSQSYHANVSLQGVGKVACFVTKCSDIVALGGTEKASYETSCQYPTVTGEVVTDPTGIE